MFIISSSMSKIKVSSSFFSGIPLYEITGLFTLPLLEIIKVISKYPFTDKFFLSFIDLESVSTFIFPSR